MRGSTLRQLSRVGLAAARRPWLAQGEDAIGHVPAAVRAGGALSGGVLVCPHQYWRTFSSLPAHTELAMPALSPTMSQGNLVNWLVKEGQEVTAGDMLADVETDKATLGWENQDDGFVAKLLVPAGTKDIAVGTPVAVLVDSEEDVAAFADYAPGSSAPAAAAAAAPAAGAAAEPAAAAAPHVEVSDRLGPAARYLLSGAGLPPSAITPTGPRGIVTKGDVLAAISAGVKAPAPQQPAAAPAAAAAPPAAQAPKQQAAAAAPPPKPRPVTAPAPAAPPKPAPGTSYTDVPLSQIRRIIAQRLQQSKQTIPHLYLSADVDLDAVTSLRASLKQQGTKVSVNDCVVRAVALALAEVPAANAVWDAQQEAATPAGGVDVAIAVATETGLITPIVRGADKKGLAAIAAEVRELAARARLNKLKPKEFTGGSFTISNLGMFGIDKFFAIINPPQACIMAVGGGREVMEMVHGQLHTTTVMTVTLSADNRVYDGEVASQFLAAFRRHINTPFALL